MEKKAAVQCSPVSARCVALLPIQKLLGGGAASLFGPGGYRFFEPGVQGEGEN